MRCAGVLDGAQMKKLLYALAALLVAQPAIAERAATWFALTPDNASPGAEMEAPFEGFFYIRTARYEGVARLLDPYVVDAKDVSLNQLPAGEELFLTWTDTGIYYCSTVRLLKDVNQIRPGEILGAALGVNLFGGSFFARDKNWQCFRDADKDMRFEVVAGGQRNLALVNSIQIIDDNTPLSPPLRYELLDKETLPVKLEVGLSGQVLDQKAGRYRVAACMKPSGGTDYCIPGVYDTIRVGHDLPADIDFMDGIVTIPSIAPDDAGRLRVRFHIKKPVGASRIFQTFKLFYPNDLQYSISYASGPAPAEKPH